MVPTRILVRALNAPDIEEARAIARSYVTTRGVIHKREELDMSDKFPMILVDGWPDGVVEETAWVEFTPETDRKNKAIEFLAKNFPAEEPLLESTNGNVYRAEDECVWQRPCGMKVEGGHYDYDDGEHANPCEECDGELEVEEFEFPDGPKLGDPVPTGKKVACGYCFGTGKEGSLHEAGEGPWEPCEPGDDGGLEFWVIRLVEEES
jgi:hypothetical protein